MATLWLSNKPKNIKIGSEKKEIWSKHCFNHISFISKPILMFLGWLESPQCPVSVPVKYPQWGRVSGRNGDGFDSEDKSGFGKESLALGAVQGGGDVMPFVLSWCCALTCTYILTYLYLPNHLSTLSDSAQSYISNMWTYFKSSLNWLFPLEMAWNGFQVISSTSSYSRWDFTLTFLPLNVF
jgi:hypothetical protein